MAAQLNIFHFGTMPHYRKSADGKDRRALRDLNELKQFVHQIREQLQKPPDEIRLRFVKIESMPMELPIAIF
jgi:hypothetical protein